MNNELEKLDAIRNRIPNVSYEEARRALAETSGDVVQALINLEKIKGDLLSVGIELIDDVQKLMESRGANRLKVKFGEKTIAEYPVALTAAAAFVVGLAAVLISKSSVEVEQEEGTPEGEP
ncbi:MAG: hypothetical protein HYX78_14740 [Armatimonadetes bacterium]|nr:hypothetical protein [Armatimonadota bacterium]